MDPGHEFAERAVPCGFGCQKAVFCSEACRLAAQSDPGSHSAIVCSIMSSVNADGASDETFSALHFLSRVFGLIFADHAHRGGPSTTRLAALFSLSEGNSAVMLQDGSYIAWLKDVYDRFVPPLQDKLEDLPMNFASQEFLASISLRDLVNAYGIRAPPRFGNESCMIRGTAVYSHAARINHECLPNVCRCEDFDQTPQENSPFANMCMTFRALHDLPAGEEITQSYFPLCWDFENRQTRCSHVYGFACTCPRCAMESEGKISNPKNEVADEHYVSIFLLKYGCIDEDCEGTMVPVLGSRDKVQICNVCSKSQTEAEFLHELEN